MKHLAYIHEKRKRKRYNHSFWYLYPFPFFFFFSFIHTLHPGGKWLNINGTTDEKIVSFATEYGQTNAFINVSCVFKNSGTNYASVHGFPDRLPSVVVQSSRNNGGQRGENVFVVFEFVLQLHFRDVNSLVSQFARIHTGS